MDADEEPETEAKEPNQLRWMRKVRMPRRMMKMRGKGR
jgi:hypothetical protein